MPNFNIVPVRGLPIVAALLIGLVVAIASNNLWALEFFHVAGGGLWTSLDLFLGLILGPIMGSLVHSRPVSSSRPSSCRRCC